MEALTYSSEAYGFYDTNAAVFGLGLAGFVQLQHA